jgi:hypothetical protein
LKLFNVGLRNVFVLVSKEIKKRKDLGEKKEEKEYERKV